MTRKMHLDGMVLGPVSTNCYFVQNTETGELLIIDPADYPDQIISKVMKCQGKPVAILLTHGHFDHIMAVNEIREKYQIPVYCEKHEEEMLKDPMKNVSGAWYKPYSTHADHLLSDNEELELAGFRIRVLHTPGHTPGCCCYEFPEEHVLFSGDTLFFRSYGRVDFPGGSARQMQDSVQRLLKELPEETEVYPGHDCATDIASEKRYNPLA